jgi:hypothetical protein
MATRDHNAHGLVNSLPDAIDPEALTAESRPDDLLQCIVPRVLGTYVARNGTGSFPLMEQQPAAIALQQY